MPEADEREEEEFVHALLLRFFDLRSPNQERVALFVHERLETRLYFSAMMSPYIFGIFISCSDLILATTDVIH